MEHFDPSFFYRGLTTPASELISRTSTEIIASSVPLKMSFGIIASLFSASLGVSAIMDGLNAAYKVHETRSLLKQYLVALGLTLGTRLLLSLATVSVSVGDDLVNALGAPHSLIVSWRIIEWPLTLVLL